MENKEQAERLIKMIFGENIKKLTCDNCNDCPDYDCPDNTANIE